MLDSRIQNLHLLPGKRTDNGIAQARLAVAVARAFIRQEVAARGEKAGLKLLERVTDIASDIAAVRGLLIPITGRHLSGGRVDLVAARQRNVPHGPVAGRLWRYIEEQAPKLSTGFAAQAAA